MRLILFMLVLSCGSLGMLKAQNISFSSGEIETQVRQYDSKDNQKLADTLESLRNKSEKKVYELPDLNQTVEQCATILVLDYKKNGSQKIKLFLADKNQDINLIGLKALGTLFWDGQKNTDFSPEIRTYINSSNKELKLQALLIAGKLGDQSLLDILESSIKTNDEYTYIFAATALVSTVNKDQYDKLLPLLDGMHVGIAESAIEKIGGDERFRKDFYRLGNSKNAMTRAMGAVGIAKTKKWTKEDQNYVNKAFDSLNERGQVSLLSALISRADNRYDTPRMNEYIKRLISLRESKEIQTRRDVALLLSNHPKIVKNHVKEVKELLNDPDEEVRKWAAIAINNLNEQDSPLFKKEVTQLVRQYNSKDNQKLAEKLDSLRYDKNKRPEEIKALYYAIEFSVPVLVEDYKKNGPEKIKLFLTDKNQDINLIGLKALHIIFLNKSQRTTDYTPQIREFIQSPIMDLKCSALACASLLADQSLLDVIEASYSTNTSPEMFSVNSAAASALANTVSEDQYDKLLRLLESQEHGIAQSAIEKIGGDERFRKDFYRMTSSENVITREVGAVGIAKIKKLSPEDQDYLDKVFDTLTEIGQMNLLSALTYRKSLGYDTPKINEYINRWISLSKSKEDETRRYVALLLTHHPEIVKDHLKEVNYLLNDPDEEVRKWAGIAIDNLKKG